MKTTIQIVLISACLATACSRSDGEAERTDIADDANYGLMSSSQILVTSEQGDRLAPMANVNFVDGQAEGAPDDITDVCVYRNMRYRFSTSSVVEERTA